MKEIVTQNLCDVLVTLKMKYIVVINGKDHIIWYHSFGSCYMFYPIQFFFLFVFCFRFVFCYVICVLFRILVCVLLRSFLRSCLCSYFRSCFCYVLLLVSFRFSVKNFVWIMFQILLQILFGNNLAYFKNLGV